MQLLYERVKYEDLEECEHRRNHGFPVDCHFLRGCTGKLQVSPTLQPRTVFFILLHWAVALFDRTLRARLLAREMQEWHMDSSATGQRCGVHRQ